MNPRIAKQTVGRVLCLLLVVFIVRSEVDAVSIEDFDNLLLFDDTTSLKVLESNTATSDKKEDSIEGETERPRLIKPEEPLGMDSLTIIWYLTTFTALLGFFVVMACTEKSCTRSRDTKPPEARTCPPTPCPSYKNFAPPSYDTVMKKYKNQRIFIVPVHDNNSVFSPTSSTDTTQHQVTTTTSVDNDKVVEVVVQ